VARVKPETTAVENRTARHAMLIVGMWEAVAEDERNIAWVRQLHSRMEPHSSGGVYTNFDSDAADSRSRSVYSPEKLTRLQALKDKYDPANFYRLNQNIRPRSG
jgi:hypothetical protein